MNRASDSSIQELLELIRDPASRLAVRQYLDSSLDLLADFSGTPAEYDSLVYNILLCICEIANNTHPEADCRPIPERHIVELKKKLNISGGDASFGIEYPPVVRMMKDYIDQRYNQQIKITDLAELTGFSPNYAGKLFRENIGTSVPNYINYLRIKKACELLANTNMKIYQIAYQVGYSESYYFSNLFKKLMKVTPIEYRKDPAKRETLPFPVIDL